MSPVVAISKIHRSLTTRDYVALIFLVVCLSSLAGVFISWQNAEAAKKIAIDSRNHLRLARVETEVGLCRAQNKTRRVVDLDRRTFQRALAEAKRDKKKITDPLLKALFQKSIEFDRQELRNRPYLAPLNCRALVVDAAKLPRRH